MTSVFPVPTLEVADLAQRLVAEYPDLPASRVLRCLAWAFRRAQSWGCPEEHLVTTVEASTRWGLAQTPSGWTCR